MCYSNPVSSSPIMSYSASATSGTSGGGGWLEAMAKALGEAAGELANKMNDLANKINQENGATGSGANTSTPVGSDPSDPSGATQSITDNTQLQALSQEFTTLMNAIKDVISSIGQAEASMAQKG